MLHFDINGKFSNIVIVAIKYGIIGVVVLNSLSRRQCVQSSQRLGCAWPNVYHPISQWMGLSNWRRFCVLCQSLCVLATKICVPITDSNYSELGIDNTRWKVIRPAHRLDWQSMQLHGALQSCTEWLQLPFVSQFVRQPRFVFTRERPSSYHLVDALYYRATKLSWQCC